MVHLTRRAVLAGLTAALAAPAVVKAESLMRLYVPPKPKLLVSSGRLWTKGGKVAGTWQHNANGTIDFHYRNPDLPDDGEPMNGVRYMSGQNNSFERAMRGAMRLASIAVPDAPVSIKNLPSTPFGTGWPAAVRACIRGMLTPTKTEIRGPSGPTLSVIAGKVQIP